MSFRGRRRGRTAHAALRERRCLPGARDASFKVPEAIERKALTPREVAASHNNFYEFLPGRGGPVWRHTADYEVVPWKIEVKGECAKPATFDLDDLLAFDQEERIYHFRCVERWAMNVPWTGFPHREAARQSVEPKSSARIRPSFDERAEAGSDAGRA